MDKESEVPEKRFEDYVQVFNAQGVAIGFTLPGSDFLFRYDNQGGWKDQKGNYYNSKGVLQKVADGVSDDDEQDVPDEQQLDEFERMLDDEGSSPKKTKKTEQAAKKQEPENYETETSKFLDNYTNKKNIRQGLPQQLHIFFKMRTKFFDRVKPIVQKAQSVAEANEKVKEIKLKIGEKEKQLRQANKWIDLGGEFDFSGAQLDEATYDRYWYGFIKTTADKYKQALANIEKSAEFALLEHKTFYALKSKFYLKKKMQETITNLSKALEGLSDDALVRVTADNLPENFPLSFIFDLCSFSDTPIEQIFSIQIIDDFKAEIFMSKKGAAKFVNVEGYCHDDKEFIQLDVQGDKKQRKLVKSGMYKVSLTTNKNNPYKTHVCELHDTLGLEKSRDQFLKLFEQTEEKENGGFRFIVGIKCIKRVTMFRGSSLDVIKLELFEKK